MRSSRYRSLHPLLVLTSLLLISPIALDVTAQENIIHVVQPGETLYRIGLRYNVTVATLAQANNIQNTERILAGQQLVIPDLSRAVETDLFASEPTYHIVQPGETLASIANRYGITVSQIAKLNNISNPNHIEAGKTLTVFELSETAIETNTSANESNDMSETTYIMQRGETLADVATRFGVTWPAIVQANNITDPNRVQAGQRIIIPNASDIQDLGIIDPSMAPRSGPESVIKQGKNIIVDISDSRIYAYEDGRLVYSALVSTGLPATPTVQGSFRVQRRYESQTMSGPDYYLPNVQWILYFYAGYAIHGTYWHNNFGQPMSHGCVNLPNEEALWFYDFAPIGTPVLVQA
ncbi:MAG: hypothetical protein CL610_15680 [Anaerolineaceae bacterium]|nr:hypothetical protein [Anaerolineaceae bacterium]